MKKSLLTLFAVLTLFLSLSPRSQAQTDRKTVYELTLIATDTARTDRRTVACITRR